MRKLTVAAVLFVSCGFGPEVDTSGSQRAGLGVDTAQFNFESGVQGWKKQGSKISSVATALSPVFAGNQSLAVNFNTSGSANALQAFVPTTLSLPSKTITFHVWLPVGAKVSSIQVFAQENQTTGWRWNGNWQPASALRFGDWNTLTVVMPANAAPLQELGVEFNVNAKWTGTAYVDTVGWDDGSVDAGTPPPPVDAGSPPPPVDAGTPDVDAGSPPPPVDAGTPDVDAGAPPPPPVDAGAPDVDAGSPPPPVDAGTPPPPPVDAGTVTSIRFGGHGGYDGLFNNSPVDPNLRTVTGWFHLRVSTVNQNRQEVSWSIENNPPSTNYHLMVTTWHGDQWESHDKQWGGGFLFAPVDLGWWFIAESNNASLHRTILYSKKAGASALNVYNTGQYHPLVTTAFTRFLVGTDDATGQNEWMDGDLAGIKVWNTELTQAEIEAESQHLNPVRQSNLWAYYPLQDLPTMLFDYSGNGRNLTPIVSGGVWSVQSGPPGLGY